MLQFPAFMTQFPSSTLIPSSVLLPSLCPLSQYDDLFLALEESDLEEKWNEIKKANSNLVVIGKIALDNDKEDFDPDADDDDVDNVEESEGDEFVQEAS
ncbi:prothymosin alpha-B [Cinnamomum micranthum f. kanehirae]|uniref:Prothymosin alpha-B n=1 Tax=Cinnamomum micranthum f. kanehirae TaxID=337451 RepID=A0A443NC78_9MAGN|nr:prothymosin alpha-B [Cinnamomum micranthum f. kanehirae]